jgi:hypothetical protein
MDIRKTSMLKTHRLAALAAVLVVGAVTPASAVQVTYSTSGTFGSSGTALLNQGGAQIRFDPTATTVDVPLTTNALFGSFTTVAAPARADAVTLVDTFTLKITQTSPTPGGELVFTSTVGGTIFLNNSQAYIVFNGPLSQSLTSDGVTTTYRIVEGDAANPGRLELFGGLNQASTLNGEISVDEVDIIHAPEPGTMALACLALPLLGLGYVRRRQLAKV